MILLAFLGRPDFRVEGAVLIFCDRYECDLVGVLRVTKWIVTAIVIGFLSVIHVETSQFRVASRTGGFTEKERS